MVIMRMPMLVVMMVIVVVIVVMIMIMIMRMTRLRAFRRLRGIAHSINGSMNEIRGVRGHLSCFLPPLPAADQSTARSVP